MVVLNKSIRNKLPVFLAALVTFSCVVSASYVQANLEIKDNDGEVSGLIASIFGPDAIYPPMEYGLSFSFSGAPGSPGIVTDLQGIYHQVTYRALDALTPRERFDLGFIAGLEEINGLEILIIGEYTNSRSLNVTDYDNHLIPLDRVLDIDLDPISDSYFNPFSTIYSDDRFLFDIGRPNYYAVKIRLGDAFVNEDHVDPSCSLSNYNVDQNLIDGTRRHTYNQRWVLITESGEWIREFEPGYDPGPNLGGQFCVRRYGDRTPEDPNFRLFRPTLFLRETNTGRPIPFRTYDEADRLIKHDITHSVVTNKGHGEHIPGSVQVQHIRLHKAHGLYGMDSIMLSFRRGKRSPCPSSIRIIVFSIGKASNPMRPAEILLLDIRRAASCTIGHQPILTGTHTRPMAIRSSW